MTNVRSVAISIYRPQARSDPDGGEPSANHRLVVLKQLASDFSDAFFQSFVPIEEFKPIQKGSIQ